jgi:hypothetical protein
MEQQRAPSAAPGPQDHERQQQQQQQHWRPPQPAASVPWQASSLSGARPSFGAAPVSREAAEAAAQRLWGGNAVPAAALPASSSFAPGGDAAAEERGPLPPLPHGQQLLQRQLRSKQRARRQAEEQQRRQEPVSAE